MDRELVEIKNRLALETEEKAMYLAPYLKIFCPMIDEVSTQEAYVIFGSRDRFDFHRKAGHIHPVRGFGKKSRKFWSRVEIYNLKESERIKMTIK
jgi:hypothetical protein